MVPLGIVAIATVATARADDRRHVLRALLVGIVVCGALCVPLAAALQAAIVAVAAAAVTAESNNHPLPLSDRRRNRFTSSEKLPLM
jgi:hypothetical protein